MVLLVVAMALVVLTVAVGAGGQYVAAYLEAAAAADAAALAAAPVTFRPFGAQGTATEEAARFAAENGARLVVCRCRADETWAPRTVEVEVEQTVRLVVFGTRTVRATSRAEFTPARLLE